MDMEVIMMMNRVCFIGRITHELILKEMTETGIEVVNFTLAQDKRGRYQDHATFIRCVAWDKLAKNLCQYCKQGSLVEGYLQSRQYQNQEGKVMYVVEVVCDMIQYLDKKLKEDSEAHH